MKSLLYLTLIAFAFTSCGKMKEYTCVCNYAAIPGVPNVKDFTETSTVSGRTFEKASSKCQIDNETKYQTMYYARGVCTLK